MIGRVAELLHPGLALEQRIARLVLRLDLGIQGPVVDLARYAERSLDRADYGESVVGKERQRASCVGRSTSPCSEWPPR